MKVHDVERGNLPSASSAEKIHNCSDSPNMEKRAPDTLPTAESLQGDEIHAAIAEWDTSDLEESSQVIATRLIAAEQEIVREFFQIPPPRIAETRLWIRSRRNGAPLASAKPDSHYVDSVNKRGLVNDLKTGYLNVTPAHRNLQARWQALALWHEYPELQEIRAVINPYRFQGKPTMTDYDVPNLERAEQEFLFDLWRSQQPEATRVPGPWCRYCKGALAGICPETAAYSLLPAALAPQANKPRLSDQDVFAAVTTMAIPDLLAVVERASIIEKIILACKTRAKGLPLNTLMEHGYGLSKESKKASVTDIAKAHILMSDISDITNEEFLKMCSVPIGKLEEYIIKVWRNGNAIKSEKEAKAKFRKLLEEAGAIAFKPIEPHVIKLTK